MGERRVQKPIRLYVLSIFIVVAYGFMPFVSVFPSTGGLLLIGFNTLPFNGSILALYGPDGNASFLLVFVSLFLCVFSAASALWAFAGFGEGRIATLMFVSLDVMWWTFLVIVAIVGRETHDPEVFGLAGQLLIPPFWLGFVWWNFTRSDVGAYYKQQSEIR